MGGILENQEGPTRDEFNELNNYVDELEKQVLELDKMVDKLEEKVTMLLDYLSADAAISPDTKLLLNEMNI